MRERKHQTFSFQVHDAGDRTLDGIFRLIALGEQEEPLEEVLTAMCGDVADDRPAPTSPASTSARRTTTGCASRCAATSASRPRRSGASTCARARASPASPPSACGRCRSRSASRTGTSIHLRPRRGEIPGAAGGPDPARRHHRRRAGAAAGRRARVLATARSCWRPRSPPSSTTPSSAARSASAARRAAPIGARCA